MTLSVALLAFVTLQRLGELVLANRNTRALRARGAIEVGAAHYPLIVALHAAWLAGLWLLAWNRPVELVWLAVFISLQLARVWVIASLGARWTTRIIVLPGEALVRRGPYRFVSHPNYLVVAGEIAALPACLRPHRLRPRLLGVERPHPFDPDPGRAPGSDIHGASAETRVTARGAARKTARKTPRRLLTLRQARGMTRAMESLADFFILPAGPGDADALARVHVRAWRETYSGLLPAGYLTAMNPKILARRWRHQLTRARGGEVVLAAEGVGGLVGYCAGALSRGEASEAEDDAPEGVAVSEERACDEGEIHTLYIVRPAQRLGLGRRLMAGTARALAAQGARRLTIWALDGNLPAHAFYAHRGGRLIARRPVRGWGGGLTEAAYRWEDIAEAWG